MRWICATLLLASASAWAEPTEAEPAEPPEVVLAAPRVETSMVTSTPALVLGRTEIELALWRDTAGDTPAPQWPEPHVRDAVALRTDYGPPPDERTVDGTTWLIQRRRYLVFPLVEGSFSLRDMAVRWPGPEGAQVVDVPAVSFKALPAPGVTEGLDYIVANSVELSTEVDGALDDLRVGDALTVSWTLRAEGVDATMLPRLALPTPDGLAAYPEEPQILTRVNRGTWHASRSQQVTYVIEAFGRHTVPGPTLWWYQPSTNTWAAATAEPVQFRAGLNPELGLEAAGTARSTGTRLGFGLTVLAAFAGLAWFLRWIWGRPRRREASDPTEAQRWKELRTACRGGDATGILAALYLWAPHWSKVPTLEALAGDDAQLRTLLTALQEAAMSHRRFDNAELLVQLRTLRKAKAAPHHSALAPLNPTSTASG